MHPLLERQIKKNCPSIDLNNETIKSFLEIIGKTYQTFEEDYSFMNRSLELSSGELQEYIKRLKETNEHLKDLDKAKTDFLNVASHELKTPITILFAYIDIIEMEKSKISRSAQNGLNAIKRNVDRLYMLVNNILEISHIEAGKLEFNWREIQLKEKIKSILKEQETFAKTRKNKLVSQISPSLGSIITDEVKFKEILENLLNNAIKFTQKGIITLQASREKEFVKISISDTGIGIPKEKMTHLFENFYQVDGTVSRRFEGSGLGLSLTKKLIELQGGKIEVSSIPDKGTTFTVTLPIKPLKKTENTDSKK